MEEYGYARVSTTDQNLDRQIKLLTDAGIDKRHIRCDKASGKNFHRPEYQRLVHGTQEEASPLHKGDLLTICSIDRLGRNYTDIQKEWQYITQELKCDIRVLDMPLLDTRSSKDKLDGRFVADLVLQILSYVAEKERENIKKRQRQGLDAMSEKDGKKISKKTGRPIGRPAAQYPKNWKKVYREWQDGQITAVTAYTRLGLKKATFYNLVKKYEHRA